MNFSILRQEETFFFAAHDLEAMESLREKLKNNLWIALNPVSDDWAKVSEQLDSAALFIIFISDTKLASEMINQLIAELVY